MATVLSEIREPVRTAQQVLGHSSPHTMLVFYTQAVEDLQRNAISRLERILCRGRDAGSAPRRDPHVQHSCMRLLPKISGVEAQIRIRMEDPGYGEPAFDDRSEPSPGHRMFLTPASERSQPSLAHFHPKTLKPGKVPGYSVVVEIALHYASQPLLHWRLSNPNSSRPVGLRFGRPPLGR